MRRITFFGSSVPATVVFQLSQMGRVVDCYVNRGGVTVSTFDFSPRYEGAVHCLLSTHGIEFAT